MERTGALGKVYQDGEEIVCQGDVGDCMYVIQEGQVEVVKVTDDNEVPLMVLDTGEVFGEMAIVEREVRMATVRALGRARILTIDKKGFLRRIHEDPSLAYRVVQTMSRRIRDLSAQVGQLKSGD